MPHTVEMLHLGGSDLISYKCLPQGSSIFLIAGMSISLVLPSRIGFELMMLVWVRLATTTMIFMFASV